LFLNLFDTAVTYYGVTNGLAIEINPFMNLLLSFNPIVFVIIKIFLLHYLLLVLFVFSESNFKATLKALYVCVGIYVIITISHLINIPAYLARIG
jgi:hypothetical protein